MTAKAETSVANLGISAEEFEYYQRQFIEERSEKYALLEKVRRLEQENSRLSTERIDKDFDVKLIKDKFQKPLQNLLSRNKRESECESGILQENDALQKRLHSQEDDFQRQNALLMQEIQTLVGRNEELERRLDAAFPGNLLDGLDSAADHEGHIRSLLAELAVYRKSNPGADYSSASSEDLKEDGGLEVNDKRFDQLTFRVSAIEQEKILLEEQLDAEKKMAREGLSSVEKTLESIRKDLESKQHTVQLLLTERDLHQRNFNERLNALLTEKENLRLVCKSELDKVREENFHLRQAVEDERVMSKARAEDVERQMRDLLEQIDLTSQQSKRDSDELLSEHKKQIASLLLDVERSTLENSLLSAAAKSSENSLRSLEEEKNRLTSADIELSKLAEKRKATIDDLTTHLDSLKKRHEEELQRKHNEMARAAEPMKLRLELASAEAAKVPTLFAEVEALRAECQLLRDGQDQWARQTDEQREKYQARIAELEADLRYTKDLLDTAQSELVARTEQLSGNLGVVTAERDRLTSDLVTMSANLQQDLHDKIEELKIVERKNAGTVRDLQKQLHSEKKRLERLQVRLNEVLRDGGVKMKTLSDDSADFTEREETGSVSSWSFVSAKSMNKKQAGDNRSDSSKTETDTGLASSMTDQEIKDMVARITRLQQEKSTLLERVNMLETGNAAMAEDLLNKAAVINRYLRTTPVLGHVNHQKESDVFSIRSVIDRLGKDKSIDVETQKNLRHLLEETLTKNIHLQKNMDLLTEELDRLRGSSPPRQ